LLAFFPQGIPIWLVNIVQMTRAVGMHYLVIFYWLLSFICKNYLKYCLLIFMLLCHCKEEVLFANFYDLDTCREEMEAGMKIVLFLLPTICISIDLFDSNAALGEDDEVDNEEKVATGDTDFDKPSSLKLDIITKINLFQVCGLLFFFEARHY
ncbi:hypothetical protein ACJX0J_008129, partial [Zea mays]